MNNGASDTRNGVESSETPMPTNDSGTTSTANQPLGELLQSHLQNCSDCQAGLKSPRPTGLGMSSNLCSEYREIIERWARKEGELNNIVAHDEFGNSTTEDYWERSPDSWH